MPELQLLAINPTDAMALLLVAMLSFALGTLVTIIFVMARPGPGHPHVDPEVFEEEDEESHNVEAGDQPADTKESWEQDPDWWKK